MPVIVENKFDFQILRQLKEFRNKLGLADSRRPNINDFKFERDRKLMRKLNQNLVELFDIQKQLVKRIKENPQPVKGKIKQAKKRK